MTNTLAFDRFDANRVECVVEFYESYYDTCFIEQLSYMNGGYQRPGNGWVMWI